MPALHLHRPVSSARYQVGSRCRGGTIVCSDINLLLLLLALRVHSCSSTYSYSISYPSILTPSRHVQKETHCELLPRLAHLPTPLSQLQERSINSRRSRTWLRCGLRTVAKSPTRSSRTTRSPFPRPSPAPTTLRPNPRPTPPHQT